MNRKDLRIPSNEGKQFDCYLVTPDTKDKVPAIVLASAIHGVDQDVMAPPPVLEAYRAVPARMKNVEVHIFPGILHGYMMKVAPDVYDQKLYDLSMGRAFAILEGLRQGPAPV